MKSDNVNHPTHYADSCSIECIDIMELIFGSEVMCWYCLVNAFKYMWRWKHKNGEEDINKAEWYLNRYSSSNYIYMAPTPTRMSTIGKNLIDMLAQFKEEIKNDLS